MGRYFEGGRRLTSYDYCPWLISGSRAFSFFWEVNVSYYKGGERRERKILNQNMEALNVILGVISNFDIQKNRYYPFKQFLQKSAFGDFFV